MDNPQYHDQRRRTLAGLRAEMIDGTIQPLIQTLNRLPHCFTLQCCYGHFIYAGQDDPHHIAPLPAMDENINIEYRIAYLCLCIEESNAGQHLLESLRQLTALEPCSIQFGCADWFWDRQVNSYVLQVEPERFKYQDRAVLAYLEAKQIEQVRNAFYETLLDCICHPV